MKKAAINSSKKHTLSQTEEIRILQRIVDITAEDLDLDLILHDIVKIVTEFTNADSVFIYLSDHNNKQLVLMASKTPHKRELGKVNLAVGEGITGWVAKENKPVAIGKRAYQDPRFKSFDVLPEDRYEAFLSVPIIYKGKAIGVINVQHKKPHDFPKNSVDLIISIAKQVGGVIEHGRLYSETKQKALQFDSLTKVSQSITSEHYLDEILNLIVVVTAEMLNSKICSIMLLDDKGVELAIKATQSLSSDYKLKPNLKVEASLMGDVIKARKPVVVYDVRKEQKYVHRELAILVLMYRNLSTIQADELKNLKW